MQRHTEQVRLLRRNGRLIEGLRTFLVDLLLGFHHVAEQDASMRPDAAIRDDRDVHILLTPTRHVPTSWFPDLAGLPTLCLASGGGQQGPLLAAAGGRVTVLDNSPQQLAQDRLVAEREGLDIASV